MGRKKRGGLIYGRILEKANGDSGSFSAVGTLLFLSPARTWAAEDEIGPGIALEQTLPEQDTAEETAAQPEAEQTEAAVQEQSQEGQEQVPAGELPEIQSVYQAFFAGSGWSEEYGDNFECARAGDYTTALKASLRGQPEGLAEPLPIR